MCETLCEPTLVSFQNQAVIHRHPETHKITSIDVTGIRAALQHRLYGTGLAEEILRPKPMVSAMTMVLEDFSKASMRFIWEELPKHRMTYPSAQAAHVLYVADEQNAQRYTLDVRLPYTKALEQAKVRYKPREHFKAHETSQIIDAKLFGRRMPDGWTPLTYVWVTIEALGRDPRMAAGRWSKDLIHRGWTHPTTGVHYKVLYGQYLDRGRLLLVPTDSGLESLADLGFVLASNPKGAKRFRRETAAHQLMLEFDVTDAKLTPLGPEYTLHHPALGITFAYLDYDMALLTAEEKAFVDGQHVCNLFGTSVKLTAVVKRQGKGFGHPNPRVHKGLVIYGSHTELLLRGKKAYIGILGDLKLHEATMDIQTGINMGFFQNPALCPAEGKAVLGAYAKVMLEGTEDERRDILATYARLAHAKSVYGPNAETGELELTNPTELWATVRAFELGIETKAMPWTFRRFVQSYFGHTMNVPKGQIPMRNFVRLNVAPNPLCFCADGSISLDLDTLGRDVCTYDLPEGWILIGRNPNTHHNEAILVKNVHLPELADTEGSGQLYFGRAAGVLLKQLNGGDMDDNVWATADEAYLTEWASYTYPDVPERPQVAVRSQERLLQGNQHLVAHKATHKPITTVWTRKILLDELDRWMQAEIGLGTYINRILLDVLLSAASKHSAIRRLQAGGGYQLPDRCSIEDVPAFIQDVVLPFLIHRPDHQLVSCARHSEKVIDWKQMRKGDKAEVDSLLNQSAAVLTYGPHKREIPCFPVAYQDRIPHARKRAGDYILIETDTCHGLGLLLTERDQIIEACRQAEWDLARPIPEAVDNLFAAYPEVRENAREINSAWIQGWLDLKADCARQGVPLPSNAFDRLANGWTEETVLTAQDPDWDSAKAKRGERQVREVKHPGLDQLYFTFDGQPMPEDFRLCTAVEIMRQRYARTTDRKLEEDSEFTQSFADGLPDFILHDYMTALEQAGLTGQVVAVELTRRQAEPCAVQSAAGEVFDLLGRKLGTCPTLPNGTYTMSAQGVIVVRPAAEELRSDYVASEAYREIRTLVAGNFDDVNDEDCPF